MNKKQLTLLVLLCLTLTLAHAQPRKTKEEREAEEQKRIENMWNFPNGYKAISVGYGIGNYFNSILDTLLVDLWTRKTKDNAIGTLYLKYDRVYRSGMSFGVSGAYLRIMQEGTIGTYDSLRNENTGEFSYNTYSILLRGSYHFKVTRYTTIYGGVGLGFRQGYFLYSDNDPKFRPDILKENNYNFPIGAEFTLGTRVFFSPKWAGYAEFGLAKSVMQFGITYRIKMKEID